MTARRMLVAGRVQGVAFRASTAARARALGLVGFVRNLHDGRVEVLAQGERADLEALEAWCRHGPPAARVDRLDAEPWPTDPGRRDFAPAPDAASPSARPD